VLDERLGVPPAPVLHGGPLPGVLQQLGFQDLVHALEDVVRDPVEEALPEGRIGQARAPSAVHVHVEERVPGQAEERAHVHAVGDVAHGALGRRDLGPDVRFVLGGDPGVDAAHPVLVARAAQGERGHVEAAGVPRGGPEGEEAPLVDAEPGPEPAEIGPHQGVVEDVVARGHGGVGREDGARRDQLEGAREVEPLLHLLAAALEHQEGRVPLVDVPDGRREPEGTQRPCPPDAEGDLLLDPGFGVAPVELVGDGPVPGAVPGDVRIEEVEPDVARLRLPHPQEQTPPGEVDRDDDLLPPRVTGGGHRQVGRLHRAVVGDLVPVAEQALVEVALAVEQPHAHEGGAEVAHGLAEVRGEDAEAAGVERHALVEAELGGEVGDEVPPGLQVRLRAGPPGRLEIGVVGAQRAAVLGQEDRVLGRGVEPGLGHPAQEHAGVVQRGHPGGLVQVPEDAPYPPVPAVVEVVGEVGEPREPRGHHRLDLHTERRPAHARLLLPRQAAAPGPRASGLGPRASGLGPRGDLGKA